MISCNLPDNRFIKDKKYEKRPISNDWNNPLNVLSRVQAEDCLNQGYNIGFLLGDGIIAIDCDRIELEQAVLSMLPETYMQRSARRKMIQAFYRCPEITEKITIGDYGEILSKGQQVMLSPSKYQITAKDKEKYPQLNVNEICAYTIEKDLPIVKITLSQVLDVVNQFTNPINEAMDKAKSISEPIDDISITSVINTSGMQQDSKGQYFGVNPWHGSTTGQNFWINPTKNLGYCFRCRYAISPAKAIALNEGIIQICSDTLKGQDFIKTKQIAQEKGFIIEKSMPETITKPGLEINFMSWEELKGKKFGKNLFYIENHLQPGKINMICGPSGEFKSWLCQTMAFSIATGKPFLNHFESKKEPVLWCDKEDSEEETQTRFNMIMKGHNAKKIPQLNVLGYDSLGMLDNNSWRNALVKKIIDNHIKVVFFDTMHRFGDYKENSSDEINSFYLKCLKPLKDMGLCIVLIHHATKRGDYRGSTDLKGMVDNYFSIKKDKWGKVWINYEKVKNGPQLKSIAIKPQFIKSKQGIKEPDMFIPQLLLNAKQPENIRLGKIEELKQKILDLKLKDKTRAEQIKSLKLNKVKFSMASLGRVRTELKSEAS